MRALSLGAGTGGGVQAVLGVILHRLPSIDGCHIWGAPLACITRLPACLFGADGDTDQA